MIRRPLTNILIKPAGPDCGMACGYCFYSGKGALFPDTNVHRMSELVLEATVRQLMTRAYRRCFGWWGRATLMGTFTGRPWS